MIRKILAFLLLALPLAANAAITYEGVGAAAHANGGAVTPGLPSGHTTSDLLVIIDAMRASSETVSATEYVGLLAVQTRTTILAKVHDGTEADPVVTPTGAPNSHSAVLIGLAGTTNDLSPTSDIVHASASAANGTADNTIEYPALTVSEANTIVLLIATYNNDDDGSGQTFDTPSGFTQVGAYFTGLGADQTIVVYYSIQTTAASISSGTITRTAAGATAGSAAALISLRAAAAAPTFSVAPTVSAQDTNDYTLSYTPSTSATFYAVACKKDQTAPTIAQVKAGNCTGDVAAVAAANEAVTGADTTALGGSLTYPIHDLYAVLSNGGGDSTLATLADEMLDAPTGYQYDLLASVSATSPCKALNDIPISPTIAAADVTKWPTATSPSSYAFTAGTDCDTSYSDPSGTRQTATLDVYDTSAGDWMSGGPTTVYFNNSAPACTLPNCEFDSGETLINGVAMTSVDTAAWFSDVDTGDTSVITYSGDIPANTSITDGVWTGTPSCASGDTAGSFTTTATDEAGDTETVAVTWNCYDQVAVPDCDGIDLASCSSLADAVTLGINVTMECSDDIASNYVISQGTAASTSVDPFSSFAVLASSGACTGIQQRQTIFLAAETAVPSSAVFVSGAAWSHDGYQYVAEMPVSGVVSISGLKYRGDGALIISVGGTITHYVRGIGLTADGEVVAAVCSPDYSVAGVPMDPDGTVCMTDIN